MTIIRGALIHEEVILTANGELLPTKNQEGMAYLVEDERKHAGDEGREEGIRLGYQKACDENRSYLQLLQNMAQKLLEHKKYLFDLLKPEVIELVISICEQILRRELSNPENMIRHINGLLLLVQSSFQQDFIKIILSTEDRIRLEKHLDQLEYDQQKLGEIKWGSDSLMRRGDCRIETQTGLLNCNISRELSALQSKILQM